MLSNPDLLADRAGGDKPLPYNLLTSLLADRTAVSSIVAPCCHPAELDFDENRHIFAVLCCQQAAESN